jgi:membrane-bound lytic murein transglycosylase B
MNVVARTIVLALVVLLSVRPASAAADAHRGWGWLVEKLVADGLDRGRVEDAFDDPRMDPFDGLDFSLSAREPRALYRGFLRPAGIAAARRCREEHGPELDRAAVAEGVPASVVAAIMYIESGCGRNTGSSMILHRLARLAMANEPANLGRNLARHAPDGDPEVEARVRARARYLEDTFYPEVRALFLVADRLRADPLALHGSGSGAFGAPQFLPTSYLEHGVDGDGDGRVDLYDPADAARSCASYLRAKGWREAASSGRTTAPTRTSTRCWRSPAPSTVRRPRPPSRRHAETGTTASAPRRSRRRRGRRKQRLTRRSPHRSPLRGARQYLDVRTVEILEDPGDLPVRELEDDADVRRERSTGRVTVQDVPLDHTVPVGEAIEHLVTDVLHARREAA